MRRRWTILLGGVAALAAWCSAGLAGPPPAAAVGLSVLCPGGTGDLTVDYVHPSLVFAGDAVTGEHTDLTTFPATVLAGPDPDGTPGIAAANLQAIDVDLDGETDLELGIGLRTSTAPETVGSATGATPLDALFTENYGFAADSAPAGTGVEVLGYDLLLQLPAKSWIRDVPQGRYAARVGFRLDRRDAKGVVVDQLEVTFDVDALQAAARDGDARFPDEVRMTVAQKDPDPTHDDIVFWAVGQEVVYDGVAPDDHRALDTGATLTRVVPAPDGPGSRSELLDVDLAWDRTPGDFAVGVGQTCPSDRDLVPVAHFATNLPAPAAAGHDVDVAVRSGIDAGIDGSDEVRVDGRVSALPRRVDVVERDGVVDLVRSPDSSPTLWLRRLDLAVDDSPGSGDDGSGHGDDPWDDQDPDDDGGADPPPQPPPPMPIHAYGRLVGLPAHVRIDHTHDGVSGELTGIDVDACPELAGDDLLAYFLPTVTDAVRDSGHVDGCIAPRHDPGAAKIRDAQLVVQNFTPEGPYGGTDSAGLAAAPPPARAAEKECHYESQGPDRPWRLVCVDGPEVPRTAFVLAAAQHPQAQPSLIDTRVLLVRAGAGLRDVESLRFRTEAGSRRPEAEEPAPDDRETFGARDTTTVAIRAADEPSALVVGQLDRRTDAFDPQLNRGTSVLARGTIAPLPGTIEALTFTALGAGTQENVGDTAPLQVGWDLPTPVVLHLDEVRLQLPGRDGGGQPQPAVQAQGQVELSVPRRGTVTVAERELDGSQAHVVTYQPAHGLGSGAGGELRLRLAALVTTGADRESGRALRIRGDARITQPLTVSLQRTAADRELIEAAVTACGDSGDPATCDNDVSLDAVMGPDLTVPDLDHPLLLPSPGTPRPWLVRRLPEPNDISVVVDPPSGEDWAVGVDLRDLRHLAYRPAPGDLCLRSGVTGPLTALVSTPTLWVNGRLSRMPDEARVRFAPDGGDAEDPWIWLDTTSCTTDEPPVDATAPAQGPGPDDDAGRPVLDATALYATPGAALGSLPAPPPVTGRTGPGESGDTLAAHVERAADGSSAVAVAVHQHVPDHLLVWRPTSGCGQGGGSLGDLFRDLARCASPQWQHTQHQLADVRAQSTRAELGSLAMSAHVVGSPAAGGPGGDWRIEGAVPELPGSLHLGLTRSSTAALGWDDAQLDVAASTQVGDVKVTAQDQAPTRTGFSGDAAGTKRTAVPEYALVLHNVSDELHLTARRRGFDDPNRGPVAGSQPGEPICPGIPALRRGLPGVGYVHADVRLDGIDQFGLSSSAENVTIDVVSGTDDPRARDPEGQLATVHSDQPIEATVQTRLTNLVVDQSSTRPDPIPRWSHALVLPALLDLLVGDSEFAACLDFDLPLELTLTDTTTVQLANEQSVFAIDGDTGPGAGVELRVGEFEDEDAPMPGVPYAFRAVAFDPSGPGDFDEVAGIHWKDTAATPVDPGTTDIADCHNNAVAYDPGIAPITLATLPTGPVTGAVTDRAGEVTDVPLTRGTFVLDLLYSSTTRTALANRDMQINNWLGCPGTELFKTLARSGTPPVRLPLGRLAETAPESAEYTITQADAGAAAEFCTLTGWDTSVANRPEDTGEPDFPLAIGADGTRYSLHIASYDPLQMACTANLVARHPDGRIRWSRALADGTSTSLSPLPWRSAEWTVRLFPDPHDGSIEVQLRQRDLGSGVSNMLWVGRLDAAGRGHVLFGQDGTLGNVLRVLVGLDRRLDPPDVALTGPCTGSALGAPAAAPDVIRVWYFGDGSAMRSQAGSVDHCYSRGGDYLAHYVDHRGGRAVGGSRWEVFAPGGTS